MPINAKIIKMNTNPPLLSLDHVEIGYPRLDGPGWVPIVRDLTLSLARGSIACLLGPSGCGKSTILRAVSGFESLQQGSISLHGKIVSAPDAQVAPNSAQSRHGVPGFRLISSSQRIGKRHVWVTSASRPPNAVRSDSSG